MTATKTKNDTTSVTASIMAVNADKKEDSKHAPLLNPSLSDLKKAGLVGKKPSAKVKPKAIPAFASAKKTVEKPVEKKEDTAVAMSTDAFSKEVLTEFQKRAKVIKNSIGKIDSSFETIAFNLYWIYTKKAFKAEGYQNIESYCSETFGYKKSICYSLIDVVDRFAKRDEKGVLIESFDERVKGYGISKLSLMCNLTDAEIDTLNPSMSVRDIDKFIKGLMGKALPGPSGSGGRSKEKDSGNNGTGDSVVIDVEAKVVSDVLIKCAGKDDFEKKAGKINEYIARVFKQYPNAIIEVSCSLPPEEEKKA